VAASLDLCLKLQHFLLLCWKQDMALVISVFLAKFFNTMSLFDF
jgi:hypothetical protein